MAKGSYRYNAGVKIQSIRFLGVADNLNGYEVDAQTQNGWIYNANTGASVVPIGKSLSGKSSVSVNHSVGQKRQTNAGNR